VARRILLLITDLEIGGTPTVVRELATRLHDPPRVDVEVASLARLGPVGVELRETGIHVSSLNAARATELIGVISRLIKLVHAREYDTVFSFLVHANVVAAIASRFIRGVRWIQSIQTTQPDPRWHWRAQGIAQHAAEVIIVPSGSVARVAHEWSDVPREKIDVIANAIDPDDFPCSTVPQLEPRPYPIGFIGRLDPVKRVPELLAQFALLRTTFHDDAHLHIFGDGPERARIARDIDALKLGGHVTMHGAIGRPQDALMQLGLLVLPSQAEGFGLVLIEAMAAGVPVVATNVSGIRDVVKDGQTGLLVDVNDPTGLARAMHEIIADPTLRARLWAAGLRYVREHFSWDAVIEQYRALLV
jgi:glycosyltransferase involved in cell wall biosynthesis